MKKQVLLLSLSGMLLFSSCHHKDRIPEGVMNEQLMTDFLTEAYLLESFYSVEFRGNLSSATEEVDSSYSALLKKYGVTAGQFDSSIQYYSEHLDKYNKIHQEVVARLDAESK